jgi:anaerobic magnesium-protoporphyrin IX monomethyl ester cyclase
MEAVFINPFPKGIGLNDATIEPPLGLAYLASALEQDGFTCSIIDANALKLSSKEVLPQISRQANLIGFYLNSFSYNSVIELAQLCRQQRPETTIVIGGPLASAAPEMVLSEIPCHGLVQGEGEDAIVGIMRNLAAGRPPFSGEIPGGAYYDPAINEVVMNPVVRIMDLDRLPFPAYHLLPPLKTYKSRSRKRPVAAIITSRGCAHQCIFCSKDIFRRKVAYRSADNVLAEIDYLVKNLGARQIDILDDNFAQKRFRMEEILEGIVQRDYGLYINLQSGIRSETLDENLLSLMKRAGIYKLAFGIESADPEVLRICRKKLDLKKLEEVVKIAKKMGFLVYGFFIIGLPGETEESFRNTMDFARRLKLDVANFCMSVPFPGTELFRMVKEKGRFLIDTTRNIDSGFYGGRVFYEYENNRREEILRRYQVAYREFYSLRKKLQLLVSIRSVSELVWMLDAAKFVFRGLFQN